MLTKKLDYSLDRMGLIEEMLSIEEMLLVRDLRCIGPEYIGENEALAIETLRDQLIKEATETAEEASRSIGQLKL